MKNISIKNIADNLHLSKATVSWILSGQGEKRGFSSATIKRVSDYAKSVNYRTNMVARSLSLGQTNTIGVIVPFIDDTFYASLIQAIETEAHRYNYVITICCTDENAEKEAVLINTLCSQRVDGLIIAASEKSQNNILQLKKDKVPFVLADRNFPEIDTNYVIVNSEEGSQQVVSHLAKQGSRKIALVTTSTGLSAMKERTQGYCNGLEEAGLSFDERLIVKINRPNFKSDCITQLDRLFSDIPDVDGFFFTTHYLAFEAIRYFINHNIDYHKDFYLGCFHETLGLGILAPEMCISRMKVKEMGTKATQILTEVIKDINRPSQSEVLSNTLLL